MSGSVGGFGRVAGAITAEAVDGLAGRLAEVGLHGTEGEVVLSGFRSSLVEVVRLKLTRVLLVEMHAARVTGRLSSTDSAGRWEEFLEVASRPEFLAELYAAYPALEHRLTALVGGRVDAAVELAGRLVADRDRLGVLGAGGLLREVEFGAGDSHRGGRTVVRLRLQQGRVCYKPRSLAVDRALDGLLQEIQPTSETFIRVPRVVQREGYGWAEFVEHEFCTDEGQVRRFYFGMGMWLAVARLLWGSDLHAGNVIACGPVPVVVDCETLFTPRPQTVSVASDATRNAWGRVDDTLAYSLLLPWRDPALGGMDMSALGWLAGEQPQVPVPVVDGTGTDEARIVIKKVDTLAVAKGNHPTACPRLELYTDALLEGWREGVARINALDRAGGLARALDGFAGCTLRLVPRSTQSYVELGRSLWHPASLRDQASAVDHVMGLLKEPEDSAGLGLGEEVVLAEIDELLAGNVPVFTFTPEAGQITGPAGVPSGAHGDLITAALDSWRALDVLLEEYVIETSLANAYLRQKHAPPATRQRKATAVPAVRRGSDLEERRRALAQGLAEELCRTAVWGEDGTATWLSAQLLGGGLRVGPLSAGLYAGQAGVVIALAAYEHAAGQGTVPPLPDISNTLRAALQALDLLESEESTPAIGAYDGWGGLVWARLILHRMELTGITGQLSRARTSARWITGPYTDDTPTDILSGLAGAIPPLLELSGATGDTTYLAAATRAATELQHRAHHHTNGTSSWTFLEGVPDLGGFAHGATGIGWALARLALATGEPRWNDLAHRAFAYEDTLYHPDHGWRYQRHTTPVYHAWCHGSVGIGLAHLDLHHRTGHTHHRHTAQQAAHHAATPPTNTHSLCHGDSSTLELLRAIPPLDHAPEPDRTSQLIASLEHHGPVTGMTHDRRTPGLMDGTAGVLYQLLRLTPHTNLPTLLLPGATMGTEMEPQYTPKAW
ncbi:type 2 lanthipeptide synthetase LanM family protein [Streptomyces sp. NPDC093595]|uniref:type 2 lanthipeptide synthetase LanM family protein n=1 Tax=Streptomyces sp. NPDC093595 TaxID=3366045 RepID=UPI00382A7729